MKKAFALFALLFAVTLINAQTATDIVGRWKLIKWTLKNGKEMNINDFYKTTEVYEVFDSDGKFQSIVGQKVKNGQWRLSNDNKKLIKALKVNEAFVVDFFDLKSRS